MIELLVVVTIIVVLLALLVPAMDKAIYQAELMLCGTNQRVVATGMTTYAFDNRRTYPDRTLPELSLVIPAHKLTHPYDAGNPDPLQSNGTGALDLRPMLRPYISINKTLNDPFVPGPVDMDTDNATSGSASTTHIYGPLFLWGGWSYSGQPGMKKIGDRFTALDFQTQRYTRYSLLVGDIDSQESALFCTHPDGRYDSAHLNPVTVQDEPFSFGGFFTTTIWLRYKEDPGEYTRGLVDLNYAYDDGSVRRMDRVKYEAWRSDERMAFIPNNHNGSGGQNQVPRQ